MIKFILFIGLSSNLWAQNTPRNDDFDTIQGLIKDPVISRRCKSLLKERTKKMKIKQRLSAMMLRNDKLSNQLKPTQKTLSQRLKIHQTRLSNNFRLTELRIKSMEEDIIRKGCPGITI